MEDLELGNDNKRLKHSDETLAKLSKATAEELRQMLDAVRSHSKVVKMIVMLAEEKYAGVSKQDLFMNRKHQ